MLANFPSKLLPTRRLVSGLVGLFLALAILPAPGAFAEDVQEDIDGRYSFLRVLDGSVSLLNAGGDEETEAVANYPILTGDRVIVSRRSRADIVLSDGSQLALDENSEVLFENLSGSPDGRSDQEGTLLQIVEGDAYLAVGLDRSSEFYPIVDTLNSRIYVQEDGVYRIQATARSFSKITVFSGSLEVLTEDDSVLLGPGEALALDGASHPRATRLEPDYDSTLVAWAEAQEERFSRSTSDHLATPLAGTATLDTSGDWVTIDTTVAWKPRVDTTWRPYNRGRWAHTPSGLYWVSNDPWLPVTYRYGSWDLHSQYGWLWYPGYRYRPAHVYWYWGDSYAGWVPSGYYNRHYGSRYGGFGFRAGVIGYAGFRWDPFYNWTFCPIGRFGYSNSYNYYSSGRRLGASGVRLDRGIITTSTIGVTRDHFRRPALIGAALERGWRAEGRGSTLPDVSSLVAKRELSPDTRASFLTRRTQPDNSDRQAVRSARGTTPTASGVTGRSTARDLRSSAVERRTATPNTSNSRGAVRRTDRPSSTTTGASGRGAVRRTGEASPTARGRITTPSATRNPGASRATTRSQSPARRVIDGAGSRATRSAPPSARSSSSTRRPPTASTRSSSNPRRTTSPSRPPSRSTASRPPAKTSRSSSSAKKPPPRASRRSSTNVQKSSGSSSSARRAPSRSSRPATTSRGGSARSSSRAQATTSRSSSSRSSSARTSSSSSSSRTSSRAKKPPSHA